MVDISLGKPFFDIWETIGCACTYEVQVLFFDIFLDVADGAIMISKGNATLCPRRCGMTNKVERDHLVPLDWQVFRLRLCHKRLMGAHLLDQNVVWWVSFEYGR